MIVENKGDNNT